VSPSGIWNAHRVPFALALLVLVLVGPVVAPNSSQPVSRLSLTAALVDHGSVDLGPYRSALGVDFATYRGHLRSDKAPGQPIIAIPAYVLARLVGAESPTHLRVDSNLELWFLTLWSATLPLAMLIGLLYVECCRFARRGAALAVTLLLGFGTMFLPYGANLFAHDLAALFGFGAWLLVNRGPIGPRRAAVAGFLAGVAVMVEYELAIVVVALAAYLLVRDRRRIPQFVAGGIVPAFVLAWYQWRAFGAPWRTPAAFYNLKSGYSVPSPSDLWWMFGGGRGLWVGAPLAIVGIGTAIWVAYAERGPLRDAALVALAVMVPYIVLCAGWSGTRLLEDPGPRYLIPALPFLAVPLAAKWGRVRVVGVPASIWGMLIAASATWSTLLVAKNERLLVVYRYDLQHRVFGQTLWNMAFGVLGTVIYAVTVAGAVAVLVRAYRYRTDVRLPVTEPLR
jgi:hypothetical protein